MIHTRSALLLASALLTLSGCGVWDAWRHRMMYEAEPVTALGDDGSEGTLGSALPGHSTDAMQNRTAGPRQTAPGAPQFVPPPAPPARSELPSLNLDVTADDEQPRQSPPPASPNRLIKTLKAPHLFTPEGVRSIYDRLRNSQDAADQPLAEKPSGPIARHHRPDRATVMCRFDQAAGVAVGPVLLGPPEPVVALRDSLPPALDGAGSGTQEELPAVMQAGPSSFRHPMLADPTGVPYGPN